MRFLFFTVPTILACFFAQPLALAQTPEFQKGPVFENYGPVTKVDANFKIPERAKFNVVFDVAKPAAKEGFNRSFESAARFINMHVAAGVPQENIQVAIVVHGKASFDLTEDAFFASGNDHKSNLSAPLIEALQKQGVRFILCGQSAGYHKIEKSVLLPGVEMALSAMTAHALLQQDGYTLNPF